MIVLTKDITYGPYQYIDILYNGLLCDKSIELPFSVIGDYEISDDDSLITTSSVVVPVPIEISPRQIRRVLSIYNLRDTVEAAVASGDQELKDWWEWSTTFLRDHPMIEYMANGLGVTKQQLDDMWRLGATL